MNLMQPRRRLFALLLVPLVLYFLFLRPPSSHIPFHHRMSAPVGNTTFSPTATQQIPPYVHYVYGLSPSFGGKPFAFLQYVCLNSALVVLKPEVIYFHHVYEPTGWWWEQWKRRVQESGITRLELVKQRDVTEVFGNPVEHFAHKADVLRLEALRDYGGVYLDVDVLVVKGELCTLRERAAETDHDSRLHVAVQARGGNGNGVTAKLGPSAATVGTVQRHHAEQALQLVHWCVISVAPASA